MARCPRATPAARTAGRTPSSTARPSSERGAARGNPPRRPDVSAVMRVRLLAPACLGIAVMAVSCGGGSLRAPTVPGGGEIAGLLVTQRSDGSHRVVDAGAHIGLYTKAFPPGGPILRNLPRPVATTVTSSDGTFAFHGLASGRYWVT